MTSSEFFRAVVDEFGETQGRSLVRDLIIGELGNKSARDALAEGIAPKKVWFALCEAMAVPDRRRHGAGLPAPVLDTPA
jgi:hypothetical protein